MTMDDLLKNIYSSSPQPQPRPPPTASSDAHAQFLGASISHEGSFSLPKDVANKSVDEVWKEIVAGGGGDQRQEGQLEEMTLEDFLTKAGAVREEDVRGVVNQVGLGAGVYPVDPVVINGGGSQFPTFGNNGNVDHQRLVVVPAGGGAMRGKRRAVEEPPLDKATQQKQRRMIKNRESAARSRERKQAYTVELESMVSHLEEENARLLREEAELNKERFKQTSSFHGMVNVFVVDAVSIIEAIGNNCKNQAGTEVGNDLTASKLMVLVLFQSLLSLPCHAMPVCLTKCQGTPNPPFPF
ncbi:hypothetical protein V6N12_060811 [Hibiscus sabdariffa]|uniref:BZIP domain-containing protein n=1 Tax=Hibiscus sabdariffa TaxID=183260 RepID=A0ABR2D5L5_9ROSI